MSIEPQCHFCKQVTKYRCPTQEIANNCSDFAYYLQDGMYMENKEEFVYKFKPEFNKIPNIGSIITEVLDGVDITHPIEIVSNIELTEQEAKEQAYNGLMQEVLGAVLQGIEVELTMEKE